MRGRDTLILFVKEPQLGRVKTRLARRIGAVGAWRIYRLLTQAACRELTGDRRWRSVIAVTPDRARSRIWPPHHPRWQQGEGALGERMARALIGLARPRAVLVGSDIPGMTREMIQRAFALLGRSRFVFGPAEDGGYWLIGWRRGAWPYGGLDQVRWSSPSALKESLASIGRRTRIGFLDTLRDLDDGADYRAWRKRERRR
ncbi:MAG: TIGR04282 family arsenosugar biosynthesis glycosyltransferase [Proteobacteria bacterium]|nr:TIGR04282 family arsenosugar biosynthesis glycosyltransferase [Pseudomonadota bacterium]MBI3498397.1 TIGR04282 family arsenosugar biosynthesis glycosyltransferase [Pseudomonadota bacterium]